MAAQKGAFKTRMANVAQKTARNTRSTNGMAAATVETPPSSNTPPIPCPWLRLQGPKPSQAPTLKSPLQGKNAPTGTIEFAAVIKKIRRT